MMYLAVLASELIEAEWRIEPITDPCELKAGWRRMYSLEAPEHTFVIYTDELSNSELQRIEATGNTKGSSEDFAVFLYFNGKVVYSSYEVHFRNILRELSRYRGSLPKKVREMLEIALGQYERGVFIDTEHKTVTPGLLSIWL